MTRSKYHILILVTLCLCAYARVLDVPFYFDDFGYVANNPLLRDLGNYFLKTPPSHNILEDIYNNFRLRPLSYLTFSLNYLVHGASPAGYHLVNIFIHTVNTVLVYLLVTSLFTLGRTNPEVPDKHDVTERARIVAFFTAALFAAHPVMTNAVTYVTQRMTSLVVLFYLATVVMYARHIQPYTSKKVRVWLYLLALTSCCSAMLTKESAFTIPVALLLLDVTFHRDTVRQRLLRLAPFVATMGIIPYVILGLKHSTVDPNGSRIESAINLVNFTDISSSDYFFTQMRVIVFYFRLLFLPTGLSLEHDFPTSATFMDPGVPSSFLLHLLLVCCGIYLLLRYRKNSSHTDLMKRAAGFGIVWFYLTLSVSSSFIPITEPAVEYRLYLPAVGFMLCIVCSLFLLCERFLPRIAPSAGFWILATLLVFSTGMTIARNEVWRDPETFWRQTILQYPLLARPHVLLADYFIAQKRVDDAIKVYQEVIGRIPNMPVLHYELGNVYILARRYQEAVRELSHAIMIAPDKREAYESLARAKFYLGEFDAAQLILNRSTGANDRYFK